MRKSLFSFVYSYFRVGILNPGPACCEVTHFTTALLQCGIYYNHDSPNYTADNWNWTLVHVFNFATLQTGRRSRGTNLMFLNKQNSYKQEQIGKLWEGKEGEWDYGCSACMWKRNKNQCRQEKFINSPHRSVSPCLSPHYSRWIPPHTPQNWKWEKGQQRSSPRASSARERRQGSSQSRCPSTATPHRAESCRKVR